MLSKAGAVWSQLPRDDGVLTQGVLGASLLLGAALMALTVVVLILGKRFGYPDV